MTDPSIEEVAADLRQMAQSSADASGYFAAMYAQVTEHIAASIAEGRFEHGADMGAFAATFASFYLRVWRREIPRPRCWQAAFDVAGDGQLLVVQQLLLGINAHVNHDLPLAVVATAAARGVPLEAIRPDFEAVNGILADTYGDVVAGLERVTRWSGRAAELGGGWVFNFSLRVARDQAWGAAERLQPLDADGRAAYEHELDDLDTVLAYLITRPALPLRPLVRLARHFEVHDPKKVTAALLGDDHPPSSGAAPT